VVRPSVNDTALIKRHLDQGALTLLIPYVQSRAEAEAAVRAVRYPMAGVRGVGGMHRAARFGRVPDYTARADAEICLLIQIETAEAAKHLEDIAGVPGVDGVFIGPADLGTSMGFAGQPNHPEVQKMVLSMVSRLIAIGKPSGILTQDASFARACMAAGTTFTAVGLDLTMLVQSADRLARDFGAGTAVNE
jgi:4-hydroxy-2-oxoheptanedioate aldolase